MRLEFNELGGTDSNGLAGVGGFDGELGDGNDHDPSTPYPENPDGRVHPARPAETSGAAERVPGRQTQAPLTWQSRHDWAGSRLALRKFHVAGQVFRQVSSWGS